VQNLKTHLHVSIILLISHRYSEFVAHLYSQPNFHFHDPASFIAFVGSILPERFAAIQHVSFYQTCGFLNQDGRGKALETSREDIFSSRGDYSFLYDQDIKIRNPVLPQLPLIGEGRPENDAWNQVRYVLRKMPALQDLKISVTRNRWPLCVRCTTGYEHLDCDHLWLSGGFEQWKCTEMPNEEYIFVSGSVVPAGCLFTGNLFLRRRKSHNSRRECAHSSEISQDRFILTSTLLV
jgi:hypothetical protein